MTIDSEETLYHLRNVKQVYKGRQVLDMTDLRIQSGEILGLVGPSGAGKSTLLRLLGFLEEPASGQINFKNKRCDENWPTLSARRRVTMVFQNPQLLRRSVFDNVAYGLKIRKQSNGQSEILKILDDLGLTALAQEKAQTLSGGEAQRVALARALVLQPEVLLLDEPTANLDPFNINLIESIIKQANQKKRTTVVIVTHNVFQARRMADRIGLLLNGEMIEVAEPDGFFDDPEHPQTAAFVRGDIIY